MLLFFITTIVLIFVIWYWRRERAYLKKGLREVVSEDMKKELNFPHDGATFDADLAKKQHEKRASRTILDEMNK